MNSVFEMMIRNRYAFANKFRRRTLVRDQTIVFLYRMNGFEKHFVIAS